MSFPPEAYVMDSIRTYYVERYWTRLAVKPSRMNARDLSHALVPAGRWIERTLRRKGNHAVVGKTDVMVPRRDRGESIPPPKRYMARNGRAWVVRKQEKIFFIASVVAGVMPEHERFVREWLSKPNHGPVIRCLVDRPLPIGVFTDA